MHREVTHSDKAYFAIFYQLFHCCYSFINWHRCIRPVELVEINIITPQPSETVVSGLQQVAIPVVGRPNFSGYKSFISKIIGGEPDKLFGSISLSRIDEKGSQLNTSSKWGDTTIIFAGTQTDFGQAY